MALDTVKITLLVDNEVASGLLAEHGFAAWIGAGDECILFDTGQGQALEHNARSLGVDLSEASILVLSHGHYDHSGGIPAFLGANATAPVACGKGATFGRFSLHTGQLSKPIGMTAEATYALARLPASRRIELDAPRYLHPGIGITGPVPRVTPFEDTGGPFFFDQNGNCPDPIDDDLSMWFETTEGLVILTGCCHSGLINTVRHVRDISGIERVHGIVGGLHLLHASEERIAGTLRFLAECAPDFLVPCHCTGAQVTERLQREFGPQRVTAGMAGQRIEAGTLRA